MAPTQQHHLQPRLALTLNNPTHPKAFCFHAMYSAIVELEVCGDGLLFQTLFLQAAMKFMTTMRSVEEHTYVQDCLFTCRCDLKDPQLVRLHTPPPSAFTRTDIYTLMLFHLCKALQAAIDDCSYNPRNRERKWPRHASDLIPPGPTGATELCNALLRWSEVPGGSQAFTVIGAVARAVPLFENHVFNTPRVFLLATQQLQTALRNYPTEHLDLLWPPRFAMPVFACATDIFYALSQNRAVRADKMLQIVGPQMLDVARGIERHLVAGQPGAMQYAVSWFTVVCNRNRRDFSPRGAMPPEEPAIAAGGGYLQTAWGLLVQMRNSRCAIRGCTSHNEARLNTCGQCGVAMYCSGRHQADDWKAPSSPHKALCKAILALREAIHMTDPTAWGNLIHDRDGGRSSERFLGLCSRYKVNGGLGKTILQAAGKL
ncbi:hypothetical protein C8R43DRAFT_1170476 [Mycena crocata]|nr:hypothetical protein C8R43DRAFT_1170476 [Mycena crocata]